MLDVHVLVMDYTPPHIVQRCLDSIDAAIANAPFPVTVHRLVGEFGHLGQQRRRGYSLGTAPYVTSVDDDDWIEPNAFAILPLLSDPPPFAVAPREYVHLHRAPSASSSASPSSPPRLSGTPHHLVTYRRDWLHRQPYDRFRIFPDQFLVAQAQRDGTLIQLPDVVYNHVIYPDSGSRRQRKLYDEERRQEARMVADPSLLHWELATPAQIAAEIDRELDDTP